jgi:hypothetical protein
LVRVAQVGRHPRQAIDPVGRRARPRHEPLKAQDAVEDLGAIADGGVEAAQQLALADPERRPEQTHAAAGAAEPGEAGRDDRVGGADLVDARRERVLERPPAIPGRCGLADPLGELGSRPSPHVLDGGPLVAQLARRESERRARATGAQPRADDGLARSRGADHGPTVGAGDDQLVVAPDQVDAAVGQHPCVGRRAGDGNGAFPGAGDDLAQRIRRAELGVGHRSRSYPGPKSSSHGTDPGLAWAATSESKGA